MTLVEPQFRPFLSAILSEVARACCNTRLDPFKPSVGLLVKNCDNARPAPFGLLHGKFDYTNLVYMFEAGKSSSCYYPELGIMMINTLNPNAPGHEFGHLLKNTLHYDSGLNGGRPIGFDNNIMVRSSGVVEQINIIDALQAWGRKENLATWQPPGP